MINVGINGFGRIGRVIFRACIHDKDLEVSAINDAAVDIDYICYLIKFDSTHGKFKGDVLTSTDTDNKIIVNGKVIKVFHERLPSCIPWQTADVHYVVEASGIFTNLEKASGHLTCESVKRVLVTAPSADVPTLILGVNEQDITKEHKVISCASSTLYCLAPIIKILEQNYGVSEGFVTSIHAMTPSLKPLDGLCLRGKHWRDQRSIHQNIIPAATGACKALNRIIPQIKDKMSGIAFRVPIVNVSVLDISIRLNKNTTIADIIKHIDTESQTNMKNIIKTCTDEAVSSDFLGDENSCILDVKSSLQLSPNFFKLICWYENEYSYACRVIDSIKFSEKVLNMEIKPKINYNRLLSSRLFHEQSVPYFRKQTYDNHKTLNSSQTLWSKPKFPYNQVIVQKPLSLRSTSFNQPNFRNYKRNDIFKVWNKEIKVDLPQVTEKNSSILHNCLSFGPCKCFLHNQERLQRVKQEVSKIMDMTQNLLNKPSQLSKQDDENMDDLKPNDESNNSQTSGDKPCINRIYKDIFKTNTQEITQKSDAYHTELEIVAVTENKNHELKKSIYDNTVENLESNNCNVICQDSAVIRQPQESFEIMFTNLEQIHDQRVEKIKEQLNEKTSEQYQAIIIPNGECEEKINDQYEKEILIDQCEEQLDDKHEEKVNEIKDICKGETIDKYLKEISDQCPESNDRCQEIDDDRKKTNDQDKNCIIEVKCNVSSSLVKDKLLNEPVSSSHKLNSLNNKNEFPNKVKNLINKYNNKSYQTIRNRIDINVTIPEQNQSDQDDEKREKRKKIIKSIFKQFSTEKIFNPSIYDKIDSASDTDSENSFHINEKKSQVIHLSDLTSSVEDLARLDNICRIIEISDELSDDLFSALDNNDDLKNKRWSFKDLCERLKLDEFCNKVFGTEEKIP